MKKKISVLIVGIILILSTVILTACPAPIPDAIKMEDYFQDEVIYFTYVLDDSTEQGWVGGNVQSLSLGSLIDGDETNVEMKNYTGYDFNLKSKITELKINSISFVLKSEQTGPFTFRIIVGNDEIFRQTVSYTTANVKQIVTLEYPTPYEYASNKVNGGLQVRLENKLEVGAAKYFMDSFLISADKK